MTAWEILTAGSTLPNGTAWDHLNSQGGGGGPVTLNLYGVESAELQPSYAVALIDEVFAVEIDEEFA